MDRTCQNLSRALDILPIALDICAREIYKGVSLSNSEKENTQNCQIMLFGQKRHEKQLSSFA